MWGGVVPCNIAINAYMLCRLRVGVYEPCLTVHLSSAPVEKQPGLQLCKFLSPNTCASGVPPAVALVVYVRIRFIRGSCIFSCVRCSCVDPLQLKTRICDVEEFCVSDLAQAVSIWRTLPYAPKHTLPLRLTTWGAWFCSVFLVLTRNFRRRCSRATMPQRQRTGSRTGPQAPWTRR